MVEMVESINPCIDCGEVFLRPKRKGRPPTRCESCRDKQVAAQVAAFIPIEINEETLYHGPKVELLGNKSNRPQGRESQCISCWRIFASDHQAELHKDYSKSPPCIDPKSLGMQAFEKRGLPIWRKPMAQADADKIYGGK